MTIPKLKLCTKGAGQISIYTYDSGWRRAECNDCDYIAEPAQNKLRAARNHNERAATSPTVLADLCTPRCMPQDPETPTLHEEAAHAR